MWGIELSPIQRRRWAIFRSIRRARISLWLVLWMTVISLSAPLIANDRPLMIRLEGQTYFPIFKTYSGQDFGFRLPGVDYTSDRFLRQIERADGWILRPLIPYRFDTVDEDLLRSRRPPTWQPYAWAWTVRLANGGGALDLSKALDDDQAETWTQAEKILAEPFPWREAHWLGTDDQSRDVVARFLWGMNISLLFGLAYVILTSVIGISVGAIQGYFGGRVDLILQRILEVYGSIPVLFIVIGLVITLGHSFWLLLTLLVVFGWTGFVGITRVEFLRARNFDYVRAARALGLSDGKIMRRHVLPNAFIGPITFLPFIFAGSVTALSTYDYLGFGLPRSYPSLGQMAAAASRQYQDWWQVVGIVVPISTLTLLFVFVGDGIRQAFDPRAIFSVTTKTDEDK